MTITSFRYPESPKRKPRIVPVFLSFDAVLLQTALGTFRMQRKDGWWYLNLTDRQLEDGGPQRLQISLSRKELSAARAEAERILGERCQELLRELSEEPPCQSTTN